MATGDLCHARRHLALVALAWASLAPHTTAQAKAIVRGEQGKALEKLVEAETPAFWGAVLVAPKGEIVLARGFGLGKGGEKKQGADALFDLGAVSQCFTAVAVLQLVRAKALALDDPISRWLADVPEDKQAVTVHQLLHHTSGCSRDTEGYRLANLESKELVLKALLAKPLEHEPGQAFGYSEVNYTLLAAVIEAASSQPFETYVSEKVFDAGKLENTTFAGWTGRKIERKRGTERAGKSAHTHVCDQPWNWGKRGTTSVVSSVLDVHRFVQGLCTGRLLDDASRDVLFQPGLGSFAAGLEILDGPGGKKLYGLRGATEGYGSAFSLEREDGTTVIVLTREQGPAVRIRNALLAALEEDGASR